MKLLQVLLELVLVAFGGFNVVYLIQFNASVRVPGKLFAITIAILIIGIILLILEFIELSKNRAKTKNMKKDYDDQIASLKDQVTKLEAANKEVEQLKQEAEQLRQKNKMLQNTEEITNDAK